jgi:hypothetical protein
MPIFRPVALSDLVPMRAVFTLPLSASALSLYRYCVPDGESDQCVFGRLKVKVSPVLGLKTWSDAPFCRGSSALPGVGMVKEPVDLKPSFSLPLLLTLSVSWVPGTV